MRERLLVVALLTLGCLVVGWVAGVAMGGGGNLAPTPVTPTLTPPTMTPVSVVNNQVAILLLMVDSRNGPKPRLEGCWMITFQPGSPQYFLIGFPLDMPIQDNYRLSDYYAVGQSIEDSTAFVKDAVRRISGGYFAPQYQIIVDRPFVTDSIDLLGGVNLNGEMLNGPTLLQRYDTLPADDYQAQAEFQRQALQAFAQSFKVQPWTPESLTAYAKRIQPFSPDIETLTQLAVNGLPYIQTDFHVQVLPKPTAP